MNCAALFAIILSTSCTTYKLSKTASYSYSDVKFTPTSINKPVGQEFNIAIEPIDASELNIRVLESYNRDGGYAKEYLSYFDYLTKDRQSLSLSERNRLKRLEKYFETLDNMQTSGKINSMICSYFKEKIYSNQILNKNFGWDGSEISLIGNGKEMYGNLNPYKIDKKYLSLFKLSITNNGNEVQNVNINSFQISSDAELLYPFKIQYFESVLEGENEKMKYIYRMNMPNELKLTPNQTVEKYISTPAINPHNKILKLSYISDDNSVTDFSFSVNVQTINEKHNFTAYSFKSSTRHPINQIIIELSNGVLFPLLSNILYVDDKKADEEVKAYALSIAGNRIYFSEVTFTPTEVKNRKIKLSYDRLD